jgi:hypothetical protein
MYTFPNPPSPITFAAENPPVIPTSSSYVNHDLVPDSSYEFVPLGDAWYAASGETAAAHPLIHDDDKTV